MRRDGRKRAPTWTRVMSLVENTPRGLYCQAGDFYLDPWEPVERAVITHAHSDHAHPGSRRYLTAAAGAEVLQERMGPDAAIDTVAYGERLSLGGVQISLHPAGHVLGSSQIRIERRGEVCVFSGDYKLAPDPTCASFEPLRCHTFITESTFGLPIYRWRPVDEIFADINAWWKQNQERGRTSLIYAYSLGKSQRLLAGLNPSLGPILVHGAVDRFLPVYERAGARLPPTERATTENARTGRGHAMVVAPPSAAGTPWLRKFGAISDAVVSGWMQIRGTRRRKAVDRGFALSDHADWEALLATIRATEAEQVWVTHGYTSVMARWLNEHGVPATAITTRFEGEVDEDPNPDAPDADEPEPNRKDQKRSL